MRKAAVVGAAGFIGSHLCRYLDGRGFEVVGIDRSPIEASIPLSAAIQAEFPQARVRKALAEGDFDQLYLLAGTSAVATSLEDPVADLAANASDILNFLEWSNRQRLRATVVFTSSAAVYGQPARLPATLSTPVSPISPYGISKLAGELYMQLYAQLHSLDTRVVRPFSVYGPGLRKQVVWHILAKLHQAEPPALFGTGNETRDFVYVEDLCAALTLVAEAGSAGGIYNVCSGRETSIASLAQKLSSLAAGPPLRFTGLSRPGDPLRWRGDCPELRQLGWRPEVPLDDGLRRTVEWFKREILKAPADVPTAQIGQLPAL